MSMPGPAPFSTLSQINSLEAAEQTLTELIAISGIHAAHEQLIQLRHPILWFAFLQGCKEQHVNLKEENLLIMHTHVRAAMLEECYQHEWDNVDTALVHFQHQAYNRSQKIGQMYLKAVNWRDQQMQVNIIANSDGVEDLSILYQGVLSSKSPQVWFAFYFNKSIMQKLQLKNYNPLIKALESNIIGAAQPEQPDWIELLMLYAIKGRPANYHEVLNKPYYFPTMLQYAIQEIEKHCDSKKQISTINTVKWLSFILNLCQYKYMLELLKNHQTFQDQFLQYLRHLGAISAYKLISIFPKKIEISLSHICSNLTEYRDSKPKLPYRNALTLLKYLYADQRFNKHVMMNQLCCETLGVPCLAEVPLPFSPQFTPQFHHDAQHLVSPSARHAHNTVEFLEAMASMDINDIKAAMNHKQK